MKDLKTLGSLVEVQTGIK